MLELATGVAGPFAGKLLADFGATVVKAEPPGGDPSRRHGPFPDDVVDPEQSALFLHLNANKQSIVLDLDDEADRSIVRRLVAETDIVIESFPPGHLARRGLGPDDLRAINPALVVTSVTPFGQTGPYADLVGEDIVTYAMGGPMFGTGVESREPVKLGGNLTSYQAGNIAATATLAGHLMAEASGHGVHIDLSMFEAQAGSIDRRVSYLLWYLWSGRVVGREPADALRTLPNSFFETMDGHVLVFTLIPWVPRMLEVLDDAGLRERFANADWLHDETLVDEIMAAFVPWLYEGDKSDRAARAQAEKWAVTPLNAPVDLIDDPHFVNRGFFVPVQHPVAGSFRQPGAPFRIGEDWNEVWRIDSPAPLLDEHGDRIRSRAETAGPLATTVRRSAPVEPRLPLEGVRVIDLTVVWAGPSATMHLADLGAEVIRVDNPYVFPPATRGASPRPPADLLIDFGPLGGGYPNLDVSGRPWNTQSMWCAQARNKRSCTLDIRTPDGLEAFWRLVDASDLLVENNSVSTLDKLGIGWEALHARNPRLVCLRMPPMSLHGPYASYVGFGASFEALCGLTQLRGYRDGDPTTTSPAFHMDPASGATAAFAAMCALRRRDANGRGELVEFAQGENMMHHIGEYFIDADRTGRTHHPGGNRHMARAPQGCYRCAGEDRWGGHLGGNRRRMGRPVPGHGSPRPDRRRAIRDAACTSGAPRRTRPVVDDVDDRAGSSGGLPALPVRRCAGRTGAGRGRRLPGPAPSSTGLLPTAGIGGRGGMGIPRPTVDMGRTRDAMGADLPTRGRQRVRVQGRAGVHPRGVRGARCGRSPVARLPAGRRHVVLRCPSQFS